MCEYIVLVYLCTGTLQFARIKKLKLKPEPDQNEGSGTSQIGTPTPGGSGSETLAERKQKYHNFFYNYRMTTLSVLITRRKQNQRSVCD